MRTIRIVNNLSNCPAQSIERHQCTRSHAPVKPPGSLKSENLRTLFNGSPIHGGIHCSSSQPHTPAPAPTPSPLTPHRLTPSPSHPLALSSPRPLILPRTLHARHHRQISRRPRISPQRHGPLSPHATRPHGRLHPLATLRQPPLHQRPD